MKRAKIILFVLTMLIFCICASGISMAEAEKRSIFIGDLIELKITSDSIGIDEIQDKFKDFEIVDIKEDNDSILLTLRSFEPGEKTIQIGNKEIKIDVKSTLKEIKRDGVFEGDSMPISAPNSFAWKYVLFVMLGIFLITGVINLVLLFKRRKKTQMDPYGIFKMQVKGVPLEDSEYLVKLTKSFKEYIEKVYSCTIRGKTTSELIEEIKLIPDLQPVLPAIHNWLKDSDRFKYTGITAGEEKKQEFLELLLELVIKIDYAKEVKS